MKINEVDRVEIITLQDNYINLTDVNTNPIIMRASSLDGLEMKKSILAEHGFSAVIRAISADKTREMVFDFGFSEHGAAYNARMLGLDLKGIEAMALSHGHADHTGAFMAIVEMIDRPGTEFVVHPGVFSSPRYVRNGEEITKRFPGFSKDMVIASGVKLIEAIDPYQLLDGDVLFLGEIPRRTDFEPGMPMAYMEVDGVEQVDTIRDDTAVVLNLKGKGLIILSGCAHSGIINTVQYAQEVTGVEKVHAVMGGFHLSNPLFEPIVKRTTQEFKKIAPDYVVPTHCTGRKATMHIEQEMPDQFVLNMSGTQLMFNA